MQRWEPGEKAGHHEGTYHGKIADDVGYGSWGVMLHGGNDELDRERCLNGCIAARPTKGKVQDRNGLFSMGNGWS